MGLYIKSIEKFKHQILTFFFQNILFKFKPEMRHTDSNFADTAAGAFGCLMMQ
jgi:hypothetical protein